MSTPLIPGFQYPPAMTPQVVAENIAYLRNKVAELTASFPQVSSPNSASSIAVSEKNITLAANGSGNPDYHAIFNGQTTITSSNIVSEHSGLLKIAGNMTDSGVISMAQATINNSDGTGYVNVFIDRLYVNPGNEMRGTSVALRYTRTTADANIGGDGWDVRPVSGVIVLTGMALPADNTLRGNYKCFAAEHYFQSAASGTYIIQDPAIGFQASLVQVDSTCSVANWSGFTASQPIGGSAGTVLIGYGLWVQNLSDNAILADNTIVSTGAAAVKIDGLNTYGRILWTSASIECPSSGILELYGSTRVQTAAGTGLYVGGANATGGIECGSIQVNKTITPYSSLVSINNDGLNQGNISTIGYVNAGATAGFYLGGTQYIILDGTTVDVLSSLECKSGSTYWSITCGSLYNGIAEIMTSLVSGTCNLQNLNAVEAIGTITTRGPGGTDTGHFDTANDGASTAIAGYYIGGNRVIFGYTQGSNMDLVLAASASVKIATSLIVANEAGTYWSADVGSLYVSGHEIVTGWSGTSVSLQNINAITAIGTIYTSGHVDSVDYYVSGSVALSVSGPYLLIGTGFASGVSINSLGVNNLYIGTSGYMNYVAGAPAATGYFELQIGPTVFKVLVST